jgi:hypothetical protein
MKKRTQFHWFDDNAQRTFQSGMIQESAITLVLALWAITRTEPRPNNCGRFVNIIETYPKSFGYFASYGAAIKQMQNFGCREENFHISSPTRKFKCRSGHSQVECAIIGEGARSDSWIGAKHQLYFMPKSITLQMIVRSVRRASITSRASHPQNLHLHLTGWRSCENWRSACQNGECICQTESLSDKGKTRQDLRENDHMFRQTEPVVVGPV